jgi:type I restriction enzyme S subunit
MTSQKFNQTEIGKIPTEWEIKEFNEILIGHIKHGLYKSKEFLDERGVKILKMGVQYSNDKINEQSMEKISLTDEELSRFKINTGDLIFSRTSMMTDGAGKCSLVTKHKGSIVFDGNLLCAELNKQMVNPEFYFYFFKTKKAQNEMSKITTGTQSRNISGSNIMKMKIILPPLPEQHSIAKILSSLDEKIELNNKMNKTLEAIGQAIFKKWFVDERKGGWKEGFIGDNVLTELIKPSIDKFEGEKIYLPTANISNSSITSYDYKITFNERPSRASMQPKAGTIWFAKMKDSPKIQLFLEGENWKLNNLILSTGFAGIKPKQEALFYIWNIINNPSFEIEKDNLSMGTTMQAINNENISKIKYLIPDKETLLKFNQMVKSFYYRISLNNQEIQTLSSLRDTLLPKLMSGEVRVK